MTKAVLAQLSVNSESGEYIGLGMIQLEDSFPAKKAV